MRPWAVMAVVGVLAGPAGADEALSREDAVDRATSNSARSCAEQGGTLSLADGAVAAVDLTGDGSADDWIISEIGAFCGPDIGYLGGSGGALVHTVVGSRRNSFLAGAWTLQDIGFTVDGEAMPPVRTLLLARHGSMCDSFGAAPCLLAVTWDGKRMISAANPP